MKAISAYRAFRRACVLVALLASVPVACSTRSSSAPTAPTLPTLPTVDAGPSATATVGAEGGTLNSADGRVTLTVPAGALPTATALTIALATSTPTGTIGAAYDIGPSGTEFSSPAMLAFHYDAAQTMEDDIAVATAASGTWEGLSVSVVDTAAHVVAAWIVHLSPYGVIPGTKTKQGASCAIPPEIFRGCCTANGGTGSGSQCLGADPYGSASCIEKSTGKQTSPCTPSLRACCKGAPGLLSNDAKTCTCTVINDPAGVPNVQACIATAFKNHETVPKDTCVPEPPLPPDPADAGKDSGPDADASEVCGAETQTCCAGDTCNGGIPHLGAPCPDADHACTFDQTSRMLCTGGVWTVERHCAPVGVCKNWTAVETATGRDNPSTIAGNVDATQCENEANYNVFGAVGDICTILDSPCSSDFTSMLKCDSEDVRKTGKLVVDQRCPAGQICVARFDGSRTQVACLKKS